MNTETNFMSFENLIKLIEKHKKETHPYKRYEFDSASYTLLLIDINNLLKENKDLKKQLEENQNPLKGIFAQVNDDTLLRDCGNMNAEINELKNQQKEFIEFLEKMWKETQDIWYIKILQKYEEIIGSDSND